MNSNCYEEVSKHEDRTRTSSILKQILICSVVSVQWFMGGLCVGAPTVLIPQMRKEANSTDIIDDELGSWLYSTSAFAMYPWIIILPIATNRWGRKPPQLATAVSTSIVFIILYFSQNPYHILISDLVQGFFFAGNVTIRVLMVIDYTSPEYRGIFLAIKSASFYWGIWVANAIGTFFPWKYIAVLGIICSVYTFNVLFWPESPYWLAKQGRFDECKASYQWIHGRTAKTEQEVHDIVTLAQNERSDDISFLGMFRRKEFYKPASLCMMIIIQYQFSGKVICSLYILDIFKKVTGGGTAAYVAMLILDGATVLGMYFGSYLSKVLYRRTLYFSSSFTVTVLLFTISLYIFLAKLSVLEVSNNVTIALLTLYSLIISCGPPILALSVYGEVIPMKYQSGCYVVSGFTYAITLSWLVKLAPFTFRYFGIHGTFLFYGIMFGLCTVYLYFFMPETKNKTQQEIGKFFQGNKSEECMPLKMTKCPTLKQ